MQTVKTYFIPATDTTGSKVRAKNLDNDEELIIAVTGKSDDFHREVVGRLTGVADDKIRFAGRHRTGYLYKIG